MRRVAVLVDERDNRIGKAVVSNATIIILHQDRLFVRTDKTVRPNPRVNVMAVVFEETEPFVRNQLEPV